MRLSNGYTYTTLNNNYNRELPEWTSYNNKWFTLHLLGDP